MDLSQAYSPLVLPNFNEEKMLVDKADEVLEKVLEVVGGLSQMAVIAAKGTVAVVGKGTSAGAVEDATIEEASPNLSPAL